MANLDDVIKILRSTADEVEEAIPVILLEQQVTAKSLVQNRIQETGRDADGGQLGNYSNKKVPAYFFYGRGKKGTDLKLKKLASEGKSISYKDFRKLDGKQTGYVDLTFTGQMWRDTGLVKQQTESGKAIITIGQKTERSEKVAGYNAQRYGNFLELSEEEIEEISEDMAAEIEDIINSNLSGL